MTEIRLGQAAKRDIREAKDWYDEQKPGLDLEFRDELEKTVATRTRELLIAQGVVSKIPPTDSYAVELR